MIVKEITPVIPASPCPSEQASSSHLAVFLVFSRFLRRVVATAFPEVGKIILTVTSPGRRYDPASTLGGPESDRAARVTMPEPAPEQVTDEAFLAEDFFDARDAVQVKYEMVRRVSVDGAPVTATAAAFGYSRPSYYQATAALAASGEGLVPARPGPRGGHKLTGEILTWAEAQLAADPAL